MLLDDLKAQMFQAMKAGEVTKKEILRVAIGEITTEAARDGRKGDDEEARAILKKLAKSIEETIAASESDAQKATLAEELRVLSGFLPKALDQAEVVRALEAVREAIEKAPNDGAATGVAMKHLKASGATVDGKIVAAAVRALRG